jgi:hypothetical protein
MFDPEALYQDADIEQHAYERAAAERRWICPDAPGCGHFDCQHHDQEVLP